MAFVPHAVREYYLGKFIGLSLAFWENLQPPIPAAQTAIPYHIDFVRRDVIGVKNGKSQR